MQMEMSFGSHYTPYDETFLFLLPHDSSSHIPSSHTKATIFNRIFTLTRQFVLYPKKTTLRKIYHFFISTVTVTKFLTKFHFENKNFVIKYKTMHRSRIYNPFD